MAYGCDMHIDCALGSSDPRLTKYSTSTIDKDDCNSAEECMYRSGDWDSSTFLLQGDKIKINYIKIYSKIIKIATVNSLVHPRIEQRKTAIIISFLICSKLVPWRQIDFEVELFAILLRNQVLKTINLCISRRVFSHRNEHLAVNSTVSTHVFVLCFVVTCHTPSLWNGNLHYYCYFQLIQTENISYAYESSSHTVFDNLLLPNAVLYQLKVQNSCKAYNTNAHTPTRTRNKYVVNMSRWTN